MVTITVFGLGFVGLTTALGFAEYGHMVYGVEIDAERYRTISAGRLPFLEPGLDNALRKHLGYGFVPTKDWGKAVRESDCIYFCVGTPYGLDGQADLSYLYDALEKTLSAVKSDNKFRVLVTKSTIPPSTTLKRIIPFLIDKGCKIPEEIGVANNPEFLREGHCWDDFIKADRVVLGVSDPRSETLLRRIYEKSNVPVFSVSLSTGEFIKYLSNTSLACLISFANEMSMAADALGDIDITSAFQILHLDKRWNTGSIRNYFYPGCGYGGYCLPKDTSAFFAVAKQAGFEGSILREVIKTNNKIAEFSVGRVIRCAGKDKNTCIGILGLSFNPGSSDTRDTPSAKIIRGLNEKGYSNIIAFDPVAIEEFSSHHRNLSCEYESDYDNILEKADILVVTTAWSIFKNIREKTNKPVIDCRYVL